MNVDIGAIIRTELQRVQLSGLSKRAALKTAIASLINANQLRAGEQLPPEQTLSAIIGLSLGTVQKALGDLSQAGYLQRRQGHGTFVDTPPLQVDDLWQYRFVEKLGGPLLPVRIELLHRGEYEMRSEWTELLVDQQSDKRVYEIKRKIIVNSDHICMSWFYVSLARFPDFPALVLEGERLNFKRLLAEHFGVETHAVDQVTQAAKFSADVADELGVTSDASGLILHSLARTVAGDIISYQRFAIPTGPYLLASVVTRPR